MAAAECPKCLALINAYHDAVSVLQAATDRAKVEQARRRVIEARRILSDHINDRPLHSALYAQQITQRQFY
jgi:hypothetical protein